MMKNIIIGLFLIISQSIFAQSENDTSIVYIDNQQYSSLITLADELFSKNNYLKSKIFYQKSLELSPNENYPQYQINKIDSIFKIPITENEVNKIFNSIETAEDTKYYLDSLQVLYDAYQFSYVRISNNKDYIIDGSILLQDLSILHSRFNYQKVAEIKKQEFLEYVKKADSYFEKEDYENAYVFYKKANQINSSDKYVSKRMKKSGKLLNKNK